jgi:hypothetical protein
MFAGKARSLPLKWNPLRYSTLVGSYPILKHETRIEVESTLGYYDTATITAVKSFIVKVPGKTLCDCA